MRPTLLALLLCALLHSAEGTISYTGSSTVYPIVVAAGERFVQTMPSARLDAKPTGSSAGIRALIAREAALCGASRPISAKEVAAADAAKVAFVEVPVAYDGICVVCNPRNQFLRSLTTDELRRIFIAGGARTWKEVRAGWPDSRIVPFVLGKDSGTRAFFAEAILKEQPLREDATGTQDAHSIVQGVSADVDAIGFFGAAYLEENAALLRPVAIDDGNGPQLPTKDAILAGSYRPLSRPIFIYASVESAARGDVQAFLRGILDDTATLDQVGYVPLPAALRGRIRDRLAARTPGSLMADKPFGTALAEAYAAVAGPTPAPPPAPPAALAVPAPVAAPVAAAPSWKGPSAQQYRVELDELRGLAMDLARRSLDEGSTLEDLSQRASALHARAAGLADRFGGAPRAAGAAGLSLAEAGRLSR